MRIKDIKPGGWIRYNDDTDNPEVGKVATFVYTKDCTNGYCFHLEGQDYGRAYQRKDFKYSDNVAALIKDDERVIKIAGHYFFREELV